MNHTTRTVPDELIMPYERSFGNTICHWIGCWPSSRSRRTSHGFLTRAQARIAAVFRDPEIDGALLLIDLALILAQVRRRPADVVMVAENQWFRAKSSRHLLKIDKK